MKSTPRFLACLIVPFQGDLERAVQLHALYAHAINQSALQRSAKPMAMAGLWESWTAPDGGILRTVCIVTTAANALMAPIHDRMPVIISPDNWQDWLAAPRENIARLVTAYPDEGLQAWPVSRRVSKTAEDDAGLIALAVLGV